MKAGQGMLLGGARARWFVLALTLVAVSALARLTTSVIDASPTFSDSGGSTSARVALLATVTLLLLVGCVHGLARPKNRFGWLLVSVACLLLVTEWDIPGAAIAGSLAEALFSLGLLLTLAVPVAASWAVFAFPSGQVGRRLEGWLLVAGGLVCVGGVGLLSTLWFDPRARGCTDCPANLLLVRDDPGAYAASSRLALSSVLLWAGATAALVVVRFVSASPQARRARGGVWASGLVVMAGVCAQVVPALGRGYLGQVNRAVWLVQLSGLAALAVSVFVSLLRSRSMRRSVGSLVVDLHRAAAAGGMTQALSSWLKDPSLQVAYFVAGAYRDVDLTPVDVPPGQGRGMSHLVHGGEEVAVLVHRPGLLDNPDQLREVVAAARLGLENERLRAEGLAQVRALADSRVRIIEAGDRERRRLERDLHDGAQQRLVALLLGLRLLRATVERERPDAVGLVDEAEAEMQRAVRELRELAAGLFPSILLTEGLAGAWGALGEGAPVNVVRAPEGRFPSVVETTAYLVVSAAAAQGEVTVSADCDEHSLRVHADVACDGLDLTAVGDRVAAVDGRMSVSRFEGGSRVELELPLELGGRKEGSCELSSRTTPC